MDEVRNELKISGSGSANGGLYSDVKISGSGTINGDTDCLYFTTSGSSKVIGNIKAKEFKVSGHSSVEGDLAFDNMQISGGTNISGKLNGGNIKVSGSTTIGGNANINSVKVSGSINIGGNLKGEEVDVSGFINIKGDCEVERYISKGGFQIGGLLNAGEVDILVGGNCRAREIGGERITVKVHPARNLINSIINKFFTSFGKLSCESIEGDNIYLESTQAKIVRGKNITIGQECEIDMVEYTGELKIEGNAVIKEKKKV
ncbi:MAG TPA: polymer-forming cytoskeletal protein [Clostridiaceae bacterium]